MELVQGELVFVREVERSTGKGKLDAKETQDNA
jgi:hypothetical protein